MYTIKPRYIIDTCSFTDMRRLYPLDVFPGAWEKLNELATTKVAASSESVMEELKVQDDGALDWAKQNIEIFLPLEEAIQIKAAQILENHENLLDIRKEKIGADAFVIATAMVYSATVVTQEKPSGGSNRLKIPDVCKAYRVECISLLEMFRREGLRL